MADRDDRVAGASASAAAASTAEEWPERDDAPLYSVRLWPHRSLTRAGRRSVMWIAAGGFALPLTALAGTFAFWGLLPFCALGLGVLWTGLTVSMRDGRLTETVTLWADEMRVERCEPSGRVLRWRAFPGFVRTDLRRDGPVPLYLTLTGGGREIELGRFLDPHERQSLKSEIDGALARLR